MTKIWLVAFSVFVCGCEQQKEGLPAVTTAPAMATPAASPKVDPRPAIACFGDSLTAGLGLDEGQSYPALLQKDIDAQGYHYQVVNLGVSGETTQDGLERMGMVLAEKPAVVVLEFGANDGLRGQPVPNTERNLAAMIETFQKDGVKVLLAGITLPPNYGAEYIGRFDSMYVGLAAKYKVPLIPFLLVNVAGNPRLMQRDGLHPNAQGAQIVVRTVWRALEPMLQRG